MRMNKLVKIMLIITVFSVVVLISNVSRATSSDINELLQNITRIEPTEQGTGTGSAISTGSDTGTTTGTTGITATATIQEPTTSNIQAGGDLQDTNISNLTPLPAGNENTNVPNANNNSNDNSLPKTGVDDTLFFVAIAASAIVAIYTYKKVRDFNV